MKQDLTGPSLDVRSGVDEAQPELDPKPTVPVPATEKSCTPEVWRIFIVAYNRLLRDTLGKLLSKRTDVKVVGQDAPSADVISILLDCSADLLLLNSGGNLNSDLGIVKILRARAPRVRVMMLGMSEDPREFLQCVRAGVAGYVLRDASSQRVLESVQVVCRGGAYCDSSLCKVLFDYFERSANLLPSSTVRESLGLTQREQELIPLLARGASNKEIADQFCLSEQTVKNHLYRMKQKVGAANRHGIVHLCRTHGLNV
jgi:two-component system, NarL family, nitrate/nitrite response regulator NarL